MDKNVFGFNLDYERDSRESYLILYKPRLREPDLIGFQADMIQNNRIPGIAMIDIRKKDLEIKLYYKISGLVSLSNYLKRKKIPKAEFVALLDRIMTTVINSSKYFLNDTSFIMDEDTIFLNPATKEVSITYIPVEINQDITNACRNFILHLIINKARIEAKDNFVQRVLALLKEDGFDLSEFRAAIKNLRNVVNTAMVDILHEEPDTVKEIKKAIPLNELKEINFSENAPFLGIIPEYTDGKVEPVNCDNIKVEAAPKGLPLRTKALAFLAVISVSAAMVNNVGEGIVAATGKQLALGGLLAAAVMALLLIYFAKNKEKAVKNKIVSNQGRVNMAKVEIESHPQRKVDISKQVMDIRFARLEAGAAVVSEDNASPENEIDETVILDEIASPFLKTLDGSGKILLEKNPIVIGRNRETCDCVIENKSIGRAHAEIKYIEGAYLVIDLDSRNGTFINGQKLISNKEHRLEDNDSISFADAEYIFCLN